MNQGIMKMSNKMTNVPVTTIDAGKFLHLINVGAKSQIAIYEDHVRKMGKKLGLEWTLVTIDNKSVIIEDNTNSVYYQADINKLGQGRVNIANLRELNIIESKKEDEFHKNVYDLIHAISEDSITEADEAFGRISKQRFRSSVIPESGLVTTRDGQTRYVKIKKEIVEEMDRLSLIKSIASLLKDDVKVTRGRIVEATFNHQPIKIPVNELTTRKVCAYTLKQVAQKAYLSEGFQNRIKHIAYLVAEDKVNEAVDNASDFLTTKQEFCMLNRCEMNKLIGETLATQNCFNKALAEDVSTLFYRTNCKINRDIIISE